ncbi:MAG: SpoIIE family protein phosphatase [Planctomycetota bacterium]
MKPIGPKAELQSVHILLVEDDPDDVWVMRNLLGDRWDGPFKLSHVELLSAGLERLSEFPFDIILLDLSLPDSQGLETFFTMHAHANNVPIVVLSGYNDESSAVKAVQAGAQDYLVKGQVDDNLLVRSIRYAIERTRRYKAEAALRDASEEFRAAREIQQRLFPSKAPKLPGFDIAGALYPAKATAGDYFDYIPMLDNCLGVVVGDVSSHGMGPALLMSETRACLRTLALGLSDVGEILTRANRMLSADTHDFHFVTLALAKLDPIQCEVVYGGAGQRSYLLHSDRSVTVLDSTSLPLGVDADTRVPTAPPLSLQPGDVLLLLTDGVMEAESAHRQRFGVGRTLEVIQACRDQPAEQIIAALRRELDEFCANQPMQDDVTIVIVKFLGSSGPVCGIRKIGISAEFADNCGAGVPPAQDVVVELGRRDARTTNLAKSRKIVDNGKECPI